MFLKKVLTVLLMMAISVIFFSCKPSCEDEVFEENEEEVVEPEPEPVVEPTPEPEVEPTPEPVIATSVLVPVAVCSLTLVNALILFEAVATLACE